MLSYGANLQLERGVSFNNKIPVLKSFQSSPHTKQGMGDSGEENSQN